MNDTSENQVVNKTTTILSISGDGGGEQAKRSTQKTIQHTQGDKLYVRVIG